MADRPKRRALPPKRLLDEYNDLKRPSIKKKPKIDKNLYEVEINEVDKQRKRLKLHFVGYSEEFDEWRDFYSEGSYFPFVRLENIYVPGEESLQDRREMFHGQLYRAIKRRLWSGRREDPETRIELAVERDVFSTGLAKITKSTLERGKEIYVVKNNRILDSILGAKWDERIFNSNGDFAYVEDDTVRYWLTKKASIEEYKFIGGQLVKSEIEDNYNLVFSFVRGDGNKRQYMQRN